MSALDAIFNAWPAGPLLSGPLHGECGETDAYVWAQARDEQPLTLRLFLDDGSGRDLTLEPSRKEFLCVVFHVE